MQEQIILNKVSEFANSPVIEISLSRSEKKKRVTEIMNEVRTVTEALMVEYKNELTYLTEKIVKKHL